MYTLNVNNGCPEYKHKIQYSYSRTYNDICTNNTNNILSNANYSKSMNIFIVNKYRKKILS